MIVDNGAGPAISNIEQRTAFTIKASARAFKLLSSNLYSDKPLAIVRELGCNALDSHAAAGKHDVPFKVVLPSELHPYFEVIDYGTGLTDEQVKSIFTTYFESTKTTSNEYIGAMGLGSKSPFAYTDAFEVFARKDGIENHYTCFLNKDGAPEIFLIETLKDDPATGVKFEDGVSIKVPIKAVDNYRFHQAARSAYRFFPVKPIVGANVKWDWNEDTFSFTGSNFRVLKGNRALIALMGPVGYPLDLNQLPTNEHTGFINRYMRETGRGFVIQYNIGDLDVNAGREGLSYDKDTIANLSKGLVTIQDEMAKELQGELDKCKTLYEAIAYMVEADRNNLFKLKWKGKVLTEQYIRYNFKETVGTEIVTHFEAKEVSHRRTGSLTSLRSDNVMITPHQNGNIVLVDDRKAYVKRIRYADKPFSGNTTFLIPTGTVNKEAFDEIIKEFDRDGVPYKYLSDFTYTYPEKDKTPKVKFNYTGFYNCYELNDSTVIRDLTPLDDEDFEEDSIVIKWNTARRRVWIGGGEFRPSDIPRDCWVMLKAAAKAQSRQLVIATSKVFDKIPDNWIDCSDVLKAEIKLKPTKKSFRDIAGNWISTCLELSQKDYNTVFANQKINPVFKEMFDLIRAKKFGDELSYGMSNFIRAAYGMSEPESECDGAASINKMLFCNTLLENLKSRYYYNWPIKDFNESLVLFSSLISHGIIDEQKLRDCFKTL